MRQRRKQAEPGKRVANMEPLAEGKIPLNAHGHRDWRLLASSDLIAFAEMLMQEKGLKTRTDLKASDSGLYDALGRRGLLDDIGFAGALRICWGSKSDDEIIGLAKSEMERKGIRGRTELHRESKELYCALQRRGLLDRVGFEERIRPWRKMSDKQLVAHARRLMGGMGISQRSKMKKADPGLYSTLSKRGLLDSIGFEEVQEKRRWIGMGDSELLSYAFEFMREKGITTRTELAAADPGLYQALHRRGLLSGRGMFARKRHNWAAHSDDALVAAARKFIKKEGICSRKQLENGFPKLYAALNKRRLLGKVGFEADKRAWRRRSDEQLVADANSLIEGKGITNRMGLKDEDAGLYTALRKRNLLDRIPFEESHPQWSKMGDDELVAFANAFLESNQIAWRSKLQTANNGLYSALHKRKLLDSVRFQRVRRTMRGWAAMSDDALVAHGKRFIAANAITGRAYLNNVDRGLYAVLLKRGLIDMVFSDIENADEREEVKEVVSALRKF